MFIECICLLKRFKISFYHNLDECSSGKDSFNSVRFGSLSFWRRYYILLYSSRFSFVGYLRSFGDEVLLKLNLVFNFPVCLNLEKGNK